MGIVAMAVIQNGIFTLNERFPDKIESIRSLRKKSETFRTLCDDHRKCCEAIDYWGRKDGSVAFQRWQEYDALVQDLEAEISELLKDCP